MEEAIEIRLHPDSLAAIEALTAAVNRVADEMAKSQQDDDLNDDEPSPVRMEPPQVSAWRT